MGLRPNEISALIKEQIKHYDDIIEQKDVGTVVTVGDGVSVIHGLDNAMLGELLLFPNDVYGMVMNLDEDSVGAVLLGSESTIKEGDEVKRTGRIIEVPVGDEMLGRVVNPLGQAIDGQGEINTGKTKPIERVASGVMTRKSVDQPLQTGITSIDAIIPIGRGQRELIIGDRQTGKTKKDKIFIVFMLLLDKRIQQLHKLLKNYVKVEQWIIHVLFLPERVNLHQFNILHHMLDVQLLNIG